jgi:hypothetical protein
MTMRLPDQRDNHPNIRLALPAAKCSHARESACAAFPKTAHQSTEIGHSTSTAFPKAAHETREIRHSTSTACTSCTATFSETAEEGTESACAGGAC